MVMKVQQAGGGGGVVGYVIRIIFDPNTRFEGGDPKVIGGSFLDHFAHCTFNNMPMVLWTCGSISCDLPQL